MTSIDTNGQKTHSHQVVFINGKKCYKDELDNSQISGDSSASIWSNTNNTPKIIPAEDKNTPFFNSIKEDLEKHKASLAKKAEETENNKDDSKSKPSSPTEKSNDTPKIIASTKTTKLSDTEKKDLLTFANSNPLQRKKILKDIEAGIANGNSIDTIKTNLKDSYGSKGMKEGSEPGPDEDDLRDVNIDFQVKDFKQGSETDNETLARLKAYAGTKEGADAIGDIISEDMMTQKVNVKLGGKTYSYTPQQIKEAQKTLATGDDDVTVIEMAYRDRLKENGMSDADFLGTSDGSYLINLISGNTKTAEALPNKDYYGNNNIFKQYEFLNNKCKNPDKYGSVVTFNEGDSDNGISSDRTYTISKVEKGNVILQDTADTSKEISINSQDFLAKDKVMQTYSC